MQKQSTGRLLSLHLRALSWGLGFRGLDTGDCGAILGMRRRLVLSHWSCLCGTSHTIAVGVECCI